MDAVIYVHGKGGSAEEARRYEKLFPACRVTGIEYKGSTPWEAGREIGEAVANLKGDHDRLILIANSIGAYFSMNADIGDDVCFAYFISPVVDMEKLITDAMARSGVTETELRKRGVIHTRPGEELSWEYLCFAREHPPCWNVPTEILYGGKDLITAPDTIAAFARSHHAGLTVMADGEHWFHTEKQLRFLDRWIKSKSDS